MAERDACHPLVSKWRQSRHRRNSPVLLSFCSHGRKGTGAAHLPTAAAAAMGHRSRRPRQTSKPAGDVVARRAPPEAASFWQIHYSRKHRLIEMQRSVVYWAICLAIVRE